MGESASDREGGIVIVGVCGSGKSLLAQALARRGYRARSVSQEHSLVPDLFRRTRPRVVIYLEASDETVAGRKQTGWEPRQLAEQRRRLARARQQADIVLATDGLDAGELVRRVEEQLRRLL